MLCFSVSDDRDRDGFISFDEFSGPKGLGEPESRGPEAIFKQFDSDHDDFVSYLEFMDAQTGNEHAQQLWDDADADRSGSITLTEFVSHFNRVQSAQPPSSGNNNANNNQQPKGSPFNKGRRDRQDRRAAGFAGSESNSNSRTGNTNKAAGGFAKASARGDQKRHKQRSAAGGFGR